MATMLLIALLIAVGAELTLLTATQAVSLTRHHRTPAHELALDSALLVLAEKLRASPEAPTAMIDQLDRTGRADTTFQVGEVTVVCTVRDDAARFNPRPLQRPDQQHKLERALTMLGPRRALPTVKVSLRPVVTKSSASSEAVYHWFDQLLTDVEPGALFRWDEQIDRSVWSDVITFWGDGRIDLRRVDEAVLEAALSDIRPGLARILLAARGADRSIDVRAKAMIGVPGEIRNRVAERITFDARRYALRIDTVVHADRRRWYVVANIIDGEIQVHHRSQLTW